MLILSFGLPLLLAAVVLVIGWKLWEKPRHAKPPFWPPPVALGLGVCLAFLMQEGWPSMPLSSKWHWLLPTTFAVTIIGATHRVFPRRRSLRFIPELATAFIAAFAIQFPGQDTPESRLVIGIATLLVAMAGRTFLLRRPSVLLPSMAWLIFATLSLLIFQTHFAKLTVIAGAASMVAAAIAVCVLIRRPATISAGSSSVIGFLTVTLAACGIAYDIDDTVPMTCWFLPVIALPAAAIIRALLSDLRSKGHSFVAFGFVALCCLVALAWSYLSSADGGTAAAPLPY